MINKKLVISGFFVILSLIIGFFFTNIIINILIKSYSLKGIEIITQNPLDILNILIMGTIILGLILLSPVIIYKIYKYIEDALYKKEKELIKNSFKFVFLPILGGVFGLFVTYFFIVPFLLKVMQSYSIQGLLGLMMLVKLFLINALIMAIIFTIPLFIKILGKLNLITRLHLRKYRKYFYLISVLIIALITPTTDAVTLSVMFVPCVLIYEGSIFTIKKNIC